MVPKSSICLLEKKYPWDKKAVDDAVAYAHTKGVLLIHAAGNDHVNIDSVAHYPCKTFLNGKQAENFIDIGALHWKQGDNMVADFSNYGKRTVDVFAPGVDIYSSQSPDWRAFQPSMLTENRVCQ